MARSSGRSISFVVPGEAVDAALRGAVVTPASAAPPRGRVKHAVRVTTRRGDGGLRVNAVPGEDVVVLHIAGGPALTLHPEHARDLMLAQGETTRARGARGAAAPPPDEVQVPARLRWRGLEDTLPSRGAARGMLGDVLLSAIEIVTGIAVDSAADFAVSEVVARVDAQVDAGVYALDPAALPPLRGARRRLSKVPPAEGPILALVHGTLSNTSGTFSRLWSDHPDRVRAMFSHYGGRVYALDHPTLGASPVANALTLARALPARAQLHLLTHSRGGLVAEVLARVCADPHETATRSRRGGNGSLGPELAALAAVLRDKQVRVERIVRVACPARGTLLASKRLDAYLSVFKWTLDLAGIPVLPALLDFVAAVAQRRAEPDTIPGLAAQIPDSPLIRWLHEVPAPIPGDLRVLAGDIQGDSVVAWVKTLLADAFYWTDNDLVVQTRSMYGGAPRRAGASFTLDRGGGVSHFAYFSNTRTADAIVHALTERAPQGFRAIGPLSWAGESATGTRAPRRAESGVPASERPAVFVLPGILGSHLKANGERIWAGWRLVNGLERLAYALDQPDGVEADGPIGAFYDDLADFLSATHEVIDFGFDWRRPVEDEARRLGAAIDEALTARADTGQPVRVVAHSMGGILARTVQLECPGIWTRMMARRGARILMLGAPNGGSWAPMQVLSGDDTFGNALAMVGAPFQEADARALIAGFAGLLQLQAGLLDETLRLSSQSQWQALADEDLRQVRDRNWWHNLGIQLRAAAWGVPKQAVLDRAAALRRRLDAQLETDLPDFREACVMVVGRAAFTPDGYAFGPEGLTYLNARGAGDGRVTHDRAVLPGVRTWTLDSDHGSLPKRREAFSAYLQLLQNGTTDLLPRAAAAAARGAAGVPRPTVRSRPARTPAAAMPPQSEAELLAVDTRQTVESPPAPARSLRITVVNGDLTFIREPLLLGHYSSARLTGSEAVMDRLVGGAMGTSLRMGVYPDAPGSQQVFLNTTVPADNPWRAPRPEAVVVVGLGMEGTLRAVDLVHTVRQAVIAWAQRAAEAPSRGAPLLDLAATLIGSGGAGISVGQSAQLIAQAVREANDQLDRAGDQLASDSGRPAALPRIGQLRLVELYLDRATEAWRALQMQAAASPGQYTLSAAVEAGAGALPRPLDSGYRGADYDFIRAVTADAGEESEGVIAYALDTRRARSEVRAQATQGRLLRDLVESGSNDRNQDPRIGRTLFQLLVPIEMEPFLSGSTEILLELDRGTAGIPWELLDADAGGGRDARPWAIRTKLVRKLRTETFRAQVLDADADDSVLVIGEPACDPERYPRLIGAREEARAVAERLTGPDGIGAERVKALIAPEDPVSVGPEAQTVITALLERDWRVVHIAGHGEPPETASGNPRGVVLSNGTFIGPREIRTMRKVPELVFVNCCYLSAHDAGDLLIRDEHGCGPRYDRPRFASGVADELIRTGVRCVIAAGWAVDDEPARTFATRFYEAIVRGERFIDAVSQAREAAWDLGGNTWAAYQCYGDPDWRFRPAVGDAQRPAAPAEELAGVASRRGLLLALETLAVKRTFQHAPLEPLREKLRHLEARFGSSLGRFGNVAEAFGVAWAAADAAPAAVAWYARALAANDGSASIKAAEQHANLETRLAWATVDQAERRRGEARAQRAALDRGRGAAAAQARRAAAAAVLAAERNLGRTIATARRAIRRALGTLTSLTALQPSMERESLQGGAFKRLAMIEALAGRRAAEARAVVSMRTHYETAAALGRQMGLPDTFYPDLNRFAAELALHAGARQWQGPDPALLETVRADLDRRVQDDPDFWSLAGRTELVMYEALGRNDLATELPALLEAYADLHSRLSQPWMWRSVYDQARFVLSRYMTRTSAASRAAAEALLQRLESFADG